MSQSAKDRTTYSEIIDGEFGNAEKTVRFDLTGKYLGITQFGPDNHTVEDRVLLSPKQVTAMRAFLLRAFTLRSRR